MSEEQDRPTPMERYNDMFDNLADLALERIHPELDDLLRQVRDYIQGLGVDDYVQVAILESLMWRFDVHLGYAINLRYGYRIRNEADQNRATEHIED